MTVDECIIQFRLPLDVCDHGDAVNNPLDNKYGGSFTNDRGMIFTITPGVKPPTFPPPNVFDPHCRDSGVGTSIEKMADASKKFCQDKKSSTVPYIHMEGVCCNFPPY